MFQFTFIFKIIQEKGPVLKGYTYPPVGGVLAGLIVAFPITAILLVFIGTYCRGCTQGEGFAFSRAWEVSLLIFIVKYPKYIIFI